MTLPTLRDAGGFPARQRLPIQAADAPAPSGDWGTSSIDAPRARDRLLEAFEREQLPGDVRSTLAAALHGDLHYQGLLFSAMIDSWPKLQKNLAEMARQVSIAPWKVHPYAIRGREATPEAERFAREVEALVWRMRPRPGRMELGMEGFIKTASLWYFLGHGVAEIIWEKDSEGSWMPRAMKDLPARYFGYPQGMTSDDPDDRLMLDPEGGLGVRHLEDFPENRFLIGVNKGHNGHPALAAPLRALSAYWLSAIYGLKWFMNFTQLYGIPWRHAEVANPAEENAVRQALATIGANGYIVTKPGSKINILSPASTSGDSLPQKALIDLADQQCDQFILGATLTSGTDGSGSRALGEVHEGTKNGVVDGIADWVGEILTYQLLPAIVRVNWGDAAEAAPEMWAKREVAKDEAALAERDEKIGVTSGKVAVSKAWFYERHGIPMPADGEDLLVEPEPEPAAQLPKEQEASPEKPTVAAADSTEWKPFPAASGTLGIPRAEMPQIASGNRAAMVNFLKARGVASRVETIPANSLKATQAEYAPGKVKAASEFRGGDRAILVSEDNHVVDGHHQWMAAKQSGSSIRVIRLMAPITRVLMLAHRMPSTTVAAADASAALPAEQLAESVLEGLTGVSRQWLGPIRPFFERLAVLAMARQVTDEDFVAALQKAQAQMPELFDLMDTQALEAAFEAAISSAALAGSVTPRP